MNTIELNPCPFCNSTNCEYAQTESTYGIKHCFIRCKKCKARGPQFPKKYAPSLHMDIVKAWNSRVGTKAYLLEVTKSNQLQQVPSGQEHLRQIVGRAFSHLHVDSNEDT